MRRDSVKVRMLLRQGADANAAQGDGMTALHWAATHGDLAEARMLVSAGARLEATTRNGSYTPLHLASKAGHAAVVKALLDAGASASAPTNTGGATPLHLAAAQGSAEVIVALLDHGAKVDVRDSALAETPLMWAAAYNRLGALEALIARGADLKATSRVEDLPAAENAQRAVALLRARRFAALRTVDRATAAAAAAAAKPAPPATAKPADSSSNSSAVPRKPNVADAPKVADSPKAANSPKAADSAKVGELPKATARTAADSQTSGLINAQRGGLFSDLVGKKGGLTPLLFAVREGNVEAVERLLKAGASIDQESEGDHTSPLLMATINGRFDLALMLLERGADPNCASDAGATPLYATINVQWAAKSLYPQPTAQTQQQTTHLQLMEALLKAGADPNARLRKHLWYMSYNFDLLGVNTGGATPFWRAAYGTDVPAMRLLVAHGADIRIPTQKPAASALRNPDASPEDTTAGKADPSGLPPIPVGGPGVFAIHAASGVGYGEGYAANAHRHAPDGWLPSVKYLVEELGADVNARDLNGFTPLHHAAARGDTVLIRYLLSKGADIGAVSRKGQTVADMANGPVQRIPPFVETVALLEKLGSKNNHKCKSC